MALNKYMHPRNKYKKPPKFSDIALKYPEFLKISKLDVSGKVNIDFKDPKAVRILTKCLLHMDFNLTVNIPEDRLVPTLPLRLNYLLWIEDLVAHLWPKKTHIFGVDIGTGACAIYPLLAAVNSKWSMVGTESDQKNFDNAVANVRVNNLEHFVQVKYNDKPDLIQHLFESQEVKEADFCMCNPPFYSNIEELLESRNSSRPQPKNGFTGSPQELITEGGEVEFIQKLIEESKILQNKLSIFTTMLGHKTSLKILILKLNKEHIKYITHTEFCQGRTMRWGLAWSFKENLQFHKHVPPRCESRKKNVGMTFVVPSTVGNEYNTTEVTKKLKCILESLCIAIQILEKRSSVVNMELKAYENTWSNQRRKRRLTKRRHSVTNDTSHGDEKFSKIDCDINQYTTNVVLKHNEPCNTKCLNNNNFISCVTSSGESSGINTNTPILHCLLNIRQAAKAF